MKKKLLYIINPISGVGAKMNIYHVIKKYTNNHLFDFDIINTKYEGHGFELANTAVNKAYDVVVAVGGDGTVNEIAKALVNSNLVLGIIPKGSGNGLARFLKIPLSPVKAVKTINLLNHDLIDSVLINNLFYINIAGIGFDAHIAHLFAQNDKRGFKSYAKLVLKEFREYTGHDYEIILDNKKFVLSNIFMLSFANATQFGNNAYIAPMAKANDGLIDVCVLKKFPDFRWLEILFKLYTRQLLKSKYYEIYKAKKIELISKDELIGHLDGEPVNFGKKIQIDILPKSLKIITGKAIL